MSEEGLPPSPATTLVIILGASEWPEMPEFYSSSAFTNSAKDIRDYYLDHFKLSTDNLLWLFDEGDDPSKLHKRIRDFLRERIKALKEASNPARDLVVHYIGHGDFSNDEYYLAIQTTSRDDPLVSSIQVKNLATTLKEARFLRRFIIIDSCFAAASGRPFQSASGVDTDVKAAFEQTKESLNQDQDGTKKQGKDLASKGTSLLFSSSRKKRSFLNRDEKYTMFADALLHVLKYLPVPESSFAPEEPLSLHHITDRLRTYIKDTNPGESDIAMPMDDSPDQDEGDIADIPFFPFAWSRIIVAWSSDIPHFKPENGLIQCYVVVSEADKKRKEEESLISIVESALRAYSRSIVESASQDYSQDPEKPARLRLEEKPCAISIKQIISSKKEYEYAINALCHAEIAIFDVTNFEPAVMLMLGIRSVVRRGVTILTIGSGQTPDKHFEAPFNIKETNIVFYSTEQYPYRVIGERIRNGFKQLSLPHYLDLPSFEAVRNIPPDFASKKHRDYNTQVLILCPFRDTYSENNWNKRLKQHLPTFEEFRERTLIRSLDMESPRLVSQTLYEAIRFTRRCLIDWTWWRPNVFFEMGVRLAVSDIDPICIIEHRHRELIVAMDAARQNEDLVKGHSEEERARLENCVYQCTRLLALFDPIPYQTSGDADTNAYTRMITRYNEDQGEANRWDESQERFQPNFTFTVVTKSIDVQNELAARSVYQELSESANMLSLPDLETKGRWSLLYPENNELKQQAEESAGERRLAAWYYIDKRYEEHELLTNADLMDKYIKLGSQSATYLRQSPRPIDQRGAAEIDEKLEKLQEKVEQSNQQEGAR